MNLSLRIVLEGDVSEVYDSDFLHRGSFLAVGATAAVLELLADAA